MPVPGRSQRGFSLIEVLVAITILLVGVLGVVAMVDGANAVTQRTKAREGATNVARSVIEVGRAVPYKELDEATLLAALDSRPTLADALAQTGHQIRSRGFTYEVSVEVCSMDDPKDDLGSDDGTVDFCPESQAASAGNEKDRNPDDYRRISVSLTWARGSAGTLEDSKQTSIVPNPIGGLGPSIVDLAPTSLGSPPYMVTSAVSSLNFEVTTSTASESVNWLVQGAVQGDAAAADATGKRWDFTWNLNSPTFFHDCTWVIGAEAFDEDGRSGAPKSVTVVLNRTRPPAPTNFEGGRNGNETLAVHMVDLEWQPGPECDVLGYQVFREVAGTGIWTQVECMGQAQPEYHEQPSCLDETAPALVDLRYKVRAVDTLSSGGLGEGTFTAELSIPEGNNAPDPPTGLTACVGGTAGCNDANGEPASDGVTVLTWTAPQNPDDDGDAIYFYRIYRDGQTYADRVASYVHGAVLAWADPDTPDTAHDYCVTAVDERYAESACSASILNFP